MRAVTKPPRQAVYAAPRADWLWLRSVRRKLHERSFNIPDYVFEKLWGLVTDPRNLRMALARVARNRGHRTPGVDGVTVKNAVSKGAERFLVELRAELRSRSFVPQPVRRVFIPKPGQPGRYRALGIPTVKDRVVQAALKQILEPIFEADFCPCSYGFRPGRGVHGALEHLRLLLRPTVVRSQAEARRLPYQWAIEGDIKACFDSIDHHALMSRVRRRIGDAKVNRLVVAFLKSGVLSERQYARTENGTPQGGVLSPLLANIALSAIDERYERWVWPRCRPTLLASKAAVLNRARAARQEDRSRRPTFFPIRYADDFIILVSVPPGPEQHERARRAAEEEKAALAAFLKESLGLVLSETKTSVTPVTEPLRFLGHHVLAHEHPTLRRMMSRSLIPKDRSRCFREVIKRHFRPETLGMSLEAQLRRLNMTLRGWGNFYRHAGGARRVFAALDMYVWWTVLRWLRKKHRPTSMGALRKRYAGRRPGSRGLKWRDGGAALFELRELCVEHYNLGWMRPPDFAEIYGEPGA